MDLRTAIDDHRGHCNTIDVPESAFNKRRHLAITHILWGGKSWTDLSIIHTHTALGKPAASIA
jgi:hypothetical protein